MRGSIRSKGRNSWQLQIYTGPGPDGKPRRHFETVRGRKGDAQRRLTELLSSRLDKGVYTPPGRVTVAEQLHQWLDGYVKTNCSQRTLDGYQSIIETHLIPALGHIQLKQFHPQAIQACYGKACEKLSARTVIARKADLNGVRFHDLRHTFASLMLLRGAKPKVISEALGHSSVAFTMDTYSHIIEGMQSDAMALLDEVLPAGINRIKNKNNANLTPTL